MIILDATTKSLQFTLFGNPATNQLPFSASYVETTGTTTTPGANDGVSNNTTAVTVVAAPASSTQRLVKNIIIQNADTAAATVTIIYDNNSTLRNIVVATLAVGDQLVYEDGNGWVSLDKYGNIKTTGGAVSSVTNTDGTLTISPTTGNVVASLAVPVTVANGGTNATTAEGATASLGSPYVIAKSAVQSSHTGDTSETVLGSVNIPANAMGHNGLLRVRCIFSYSNSANNKIVRLRFGGLSGTAYFGYVATTTNNFSTTWDIYNVNSASAQKGFPGSANFPFGTSGSSALTTGTVDTTASTTLVFTGALANSGEMVSLEAYTVELMYGA